VNLGGGDIRGIKPQNFWEMARTTTGRSGKTAEGPERARDIGGLRGLRKIKRITDLRGLSPEMEGE
jgi:hypothetical protein